MNPSLDHLTQNWQVRKPAACSRRGIVDVDPRLPQEVKSALSEKFPVHPAELAVYPTNFACPSAVLDELRTGERFGMSDAMSPWSGAAAEKER